MKKIKVKFFIFVLLFVPIKLYSAPTFHGFGLGPAKDMDIILSSNPPLPMLNYKEGTYKLGIQPTYFKGTNDFILFENSFDGWAFAANYSKAIKDNWGFFTGLNHTHFSSDHRTNTFINEYFLTNIKADFLTFTGGLHFGLLKGEGLKPTINFIGGIYLKFIRFSQSYRREDINNNTELDFDMESNPIIPGLLLGGQMGWKIGNHFLINPFGFFQIPIGSECRSYQVVTVRKDPNNEAGTGTCPETGENGLDYSGFQLSGGINISYIPWDLSINVTAPFIRVAIEDYTQADTTIITISKNFGDYER
jgi:hypothetical protein